MTDITGWIVVGLSLAGLEIFTGSFVLIFFAAAAMIVAFAGALGLNHFIWQIILFAVASIAGLLVFRKKLISALRSPDQGYEADAGVQFVLTTSIAGHAEATVEYQGSPWTASNSDDTEMVKGEKVVIKEMRSNRLVLKKLT